MKLILIEQDKVVFQTEQKCDKYNFPTLFNEYRMAHIQNPTIENKTMLHIAFISVAIQPL